MASTYSNLKIQLMATGENSGTWGNVTNVNLGTAIEEAIVGSADVTFSSADVTLTLTDTNATQTARNVRLNLIGVSGGARQLIVPAIEKVYIVNNGLADAVTVKPSGGGTGIAVPAGKTTYLYNNGTNIVDAITHLTSLTLESPLPVASGGTGSNTGTFSGANITSLNASNISSGVAPIANGGTGSNAGVNVETALVFGTLPVTKGGTGLATITAESVLIGDGTNQVKLVAPGTSGNLLTSNGTAWLSTASSSVGVGQVWQDVLGSRAKRTTYQNTTGRPITVAISFVNPFASVGQLWVGSSSATILSSGVMVMQADGGDYYTASAYVNHPTNVTAVIPNNYYYQLYDPDNNVTIQYWTELRS